MRLYDTNKHLLCLTIRIILRAQGALKILISAPYWLINKTGKVFLVVKNCHCAVQSLLKLFYHHSLKPCSSLRSAVNFSPGQWQNGCCRPVWGAWVGSKPQSTTILLYWQGAASYVSVCQRPEHSALSVVLSTSIWSILIVLGSEQCSSQATSCAFFKFILHVSCVLPSILIPGVRCGLGKGSTQTEFQAGVRASLWMEGVESGQWRLSSMGTGLALSTT